MLLNTGSTRNSEIVSTEVEVQDNVTLSNILNSLNILLTGNEGITSKYKYEVMADEEVVGFLDFTENLTSTDWNRGCSQVSLETINVDPPSLKKMITLAGKEEKVKYGKIARM